MISSSAKITTALIVIATVAATALLVLGKAVYDLAALPQSAYLEKIGGLIIQLAMLVIIGPLIKGLFDYIAAEKDRRLKSRNQKTDFLRRLREIHVVIECDRQLANAHMRFESYQTLCINLMKMRFELDDIADDLRTAKFLFRRSDKILADFTQLANYFQDGIDEYTKTYHYVIQGGQGSGFRGKLESLPWAKDLLTAGPIYQQRYINFLENCKNLMRTDIFT